MNFICNMCGGELVADRADQLGGSRRIFPDGLDPVAMPTFLSSPAASFLDETHPGARLHLLVDLAELSVRWSVALCLAEVLHANGGSLPEALSSRIRDHVERPTPGRWLGILCELCSAKPQAPLLASGAFELYSGEFEPLFMGDRRTAANELERSLLALRNRLAHGGGMSSGQARAMTDVHLPGLEKVLAAVTSATAELKVVALSNGKAHHLSGIDPAPMATPAPLEGCTDGIWLLGDGGELPLLPLATYAPVFQVNIHGVLEEQSDGEAVQVYARGDLRRLSYTPLGRDEASSEVLDEAEVSRFRELFGLHDKTARSHSSSGGRANWEGFIREARLMAEDMVGRANELQIVKAWLRSREPRDESSPRLGWISGGPGVGKSMLMARLAVDYSNTPRDRRGIFFHRFQRGDSRNNRRSFLQSLQAALSAWPPLANKIEQPREEARHGPALVEDARQRLQVVASLEAADPRERAPEFWVLVDGLDEVVSVDPRLANLLRQLAVPGTVWILAGRPEHGLNEVFSAPTCHALFQDGLPAMHSTDIRAMLLDGLGNARYALLKRDEDRGDEVHNAFIHRVVERARGLPLYVHHLLEDLLSGHLSVQDEDKLPDGLTAYYDALMERVGLSDVKAVLPHLVCLLAMAKEPLDSEALTMLIAGEPDDANLMRAQVEAALRVGTALLRYNETPDGTLGWSLYHQSFRDYFDGKCGEGDDAGAGTLQGTASMARRKLFRMAARWASLPPGNLKNHLFRWGTEYALGWQGEDGVAAARDRLADFSYLQARTAAMPSSEVTDLAREYKAVLGKLREGPGRTEFLLWEAFIREQAHVLRRGDEAWGAHKILLQLAMEHADDSPVTRAAEAWLASGACDWVWLRRARRPARAAPNRCLRVLEGHDGRIEEAFQIDDSRLVSWSVSGDIPGDGTIRIWSMHDGECLAVLNCHEGLAEVGKLSGNRLMSRSRNTVQLWSTESGECLSVLDPLVPYIWASFILGDERILTVGGTSMCLWSSRTGKCVAMFEGHKDSIETVQRISGDRLLSCSRRHSLRLWSEATGECLAHKVSTGSGDLDARELQDGRILLWSRIGGLRIWPVEGAGSVVHMLGHKGSVRGALELWDGRILSWSDGLINEIFREGDNLKIWSAEDGSCQVTLNGHQCWVSGTMECRNHNIVSWSGDGAIHLWSSTSGELIASLQCQNVDRLLIGELTDGKIFACCGNTPILWSSETGEQLAVLEGHRGEILRYIFLPTGELLTDGGATIRLWSIETGDCLATFQGHTQSIVGNMVLTTGDLLTWSWDGTLRIWDMTAEEDEQAPLSGHSQSVYETRQLGDGRIISWSWGETVRIWSPEDGRNHLTLGSHAGSVTGAREVSKGRILSWDDSGGLFLWDGEDGRCIASLTGHTGAIQGTLELKDGRVISWASGSHEIRIWSAEDGACVDVLRGHKDRIAGVIQLQDGRLVSWTNGWDELGIVCEHSPRLWSPGSGKRAARLYGHSKGVLRVIQLEDGRLLSWAEDKTLRTWASDGGELALFSGMEERAEYACSLGPDQLLSWHKSAVAQWHLDTGELVGCFPRENLRQEYPDLWASLPEEVKPERQHGRNIASAGGGLANVKLACGQVAAWHGDGELKARHLTGHGVLVLSCHNDLAFLQLYRGSQKVAFEQEGAE